MRERETSDIDGGRQHDAQKGATRNNTRPKLEPQPSFTKTSDIFGTESPSPLCRDPVAQPSEARRNDMNVMAESISDALGKEDTIGKLSARSVNSFTIEALRGFGGCRISFASGVDGEQVVDTHQRIAIAQRRDLYCYGFRFFPTEDMRKAIASANFGSYARKSEKDDCLLLGDFRSQSRDRLEVYQPSNVTTVRKPPETISLFQEMSNRQTLLIDAVYGIANGKDRRRATDFFVSSHRDSPETYAVEFTADVWERMSVDYMESMREGIRRMGPYLEAHATKVGLRKVALSPIFDRSGKTRTFWNVPATWKVDSGKGYWDRTILPELERWRDRNDRQVALGRYVARRRKDTHRPGAVGETVLDDFPVVSGTQKPHVGPTEIPGRETYVQGRENTSDGSYANYR